MGFKETYPDFAAIEEHIKRARLERSVAMAQLIVEMIEITGRGFRRLVRAVGATRAGALPHWARHTPRRKLPSALPAHR